MSLSFLLTSLIVIAAPGTGVLYTLAAALTLGSRASIAAAFGCTLGIVPHMSAAMLGLAAVLHTSALAFAALKWCGVIYLLVMAWQALREQGALAVDTRLDRRSGKRVIVTGFLINILNPKLSIFFLAFLPQFVAANGDDLAAPRLRRRLCRAGCKAGIRGAVNQKAGSRPAVLVNMLDLVTGARAERGPTRA
jgi:threonine/homoserine/homoserine lactone efflux protein